MDRRSRSPHIAVNGGGVSGIVSRYDRSGIPNMTRLGILYPPSGAEFEYYRHGERLGSDVRIALMGVRIFGDDDEHAPHHLRRTAAIENLETSARALAPLQPDAAIWACTSGSFIDGLAHARAQIDALRATLGCPATSTSLAFCAALDALGIDRVSILATYPDRTAAALRAFLIEAGINVEAMRCLDAPSGPAAAALGETAFFDAAASMTVAPHSALVIPDTAVPTLDWIQTLENQLGCTVLTANQVSLWHTARLAGLDTVLPELGRLWTVASGNGP